MFVGYPRSGHSLIGAILDAHPNIVLAHELDVLKFIHKEKSESSVFSKIIARSEWFAENGFVQEGYTYKIPNQWQGKYRELKVIGDKKGGATTRRIGKNITTLSKLDKVIQRNILLLHVIRNPFDNITTRARGGSHVLREVDDALLLEHIKRHFTLVETIQRIKTEFKFPMLDIYNEDFVEDPKREIIKICDFLQVPVSAEYLDDCVSIVFSKPHKTRNQIIWKQEFIDIVQKQINKYDFLNRYNFYSPVFFLFTLLSKYLFTACL
jgi:hypothetical protein